MATTSHIETLYKITLNLDTTALAMKLVTGYEPPGDEIYEIPWFIGKLNDIHRQEINRALAELEAISADDFSEPDDLPEDEELVRDILESYSQLSSRNKFCVHGRILAALKREEAQQ